MEIDRIDGGRSCICGGGRDFVERGVDCAAGKCCSAAYADVCGCRGTGTGNNGAARNLDGSAVAAAADTGRAGAARGRDISAFNGDCAGRRAGTAANSCGIPAADG